MKFLSSGLLTLPCDKKLEVENTCMKGFAFFLTLKVDFLSTESYDTITLNENSHHIHHITHDSRQSWLYASKSSSADSYYSKLCKYCKYFFNAMMFMSTYGGA